MNKQIFVLYFNIFLIFLGIGLVIPVLPVYLKDLGLTGSDLGLLVAAFALSQMIISPFGGTLAVQIREEINYMYRINFVFSVRIYVCSWPQFFGIDVIESDWWYECWYGNAWCDRFNS